MRKPDFFVAGAPKCGTTALDEYLRRHPQIFVPACKELHYFGSDLGFLKAPRIDRDEYLRHFLPAKGELRVGEASVWYLYSQLAAGEIKSFCRSAQIIVMLRNPLDMIAALHKQFLYECNEDLVELADALAAEDDRRRGRRIPSGIYFRKGLYYREVARYAEQVERLIDTLGRENVHVILYDDFRRDTADTYAGTCRFLGVDDTFRPDFPVLNANKEVRHRGLQFFLNNPSPWTLKCARALVPTTVRHRIIDGLKFLNSRRAPRPPLAAALRSGLEDEFSGEIEKLGRLIDRDLCHWTSAPQVPAAVRS